MKKNKRKQSINLQFMNLKINRTKDMYSKYHAKIMRQIYRYRYRYAGYW